MRAKKDPKTGKWYIRFRYTDWQGKRRETMKRGFETKHDAEEWLRTFLSEQKADLNITFADFTDMYFKSIAPRLRENTLRTKHYIALLIEAEKIAQNQTPKNSRTAEIKSGNV